MSNFHKIELSNLMDERSRAYARARTERTVESMERLSALEEQIRRLEKYIEMEARDV